MSGGRTPAGGVPQQCGNVGGTERRTRVKKLGAAGHGAPEDLTSPEPCKAKLVSQTARHGIGHASAFPELCVGLLAADLERAGPCSIEAALVQLRLVRPARYGDFARHVEA